MPRKCQSYKMLIINYLVAFLVDLLFGFDTGGVRLWLKSGAMNTPTTDSISFSSH